MNLSAEQNCDVVGPVFVACAEDAGGKACESMVDQLPVFPLPLTPLEEFLLQCDTPKSPMVMRTILRLSGTCDPAEMIAAFHKAVRRHSLMTCRLGRIGRKLAWIEGTPAPVVCRPISGSVFQSITGKLALQIDLQIDAGMQVTLQVMDDGLLVIMDAHHAVTDGNGIRQLITDWLHLYHCRVHGLPTRLPVLDPDRLQHRHRFPQPPAIAPIGLREAIRNFLVTIRGRTARVRSEAVGQRDSSGKSYCIELRLTPEQCDRVHASMTEHRVTLNEFVMACCFDAFSEVAPSGSPNERITILNPTDLRRPSDRSLPATNRFGIAFMRRLRSDRIALPQLLDGLRDEMTYVRSNYIGVEFIKGLATVASLPWGIDCFRRLGCFVPSLQWTCIGDVTRGARRLLENRNGELFAGDLKLEMATGIAPFADRVPFSVASCEIGRRITLTVHSNSEIVSEVLSHRFADRLLEVMCTFPTRDIASPPDIVDLNRHTGPGVNPTGICKPLTEFPELEGQSEC